MLARRLLLTLIAALCLSGAAFLPSAATAQRRSTNRRKPPASVSPTPTTAPAVAPVAPTTAPSPAPAKANSRPADTQATPAPATAPAVASVPAPTHDALPADAPRYYYEFTQPDFYLRHIVIEHDAEGRGQMTFERKPDTESYTELLDIAPAALARINAAWAALHFLDSTEDYQAERQMAHLGTMRLRLTTGTRTRTAEFNWTHNQQAAALTNEYRKLAEQQLFVFEITVARQYQPSNTVKLLSGLESQINRNGISDGAQLAALLTDLATDERIPLIARNQAERLIKKLKK